MCTVCMAPHMEGSNADFAPHMEGRHADFALHMEQKYGYRDQTIAKIANSENLATLASPVLPSRNLNIRLL